MTEEDEQSIQDGHNERTQARTYPNSHVRAQRCRTRRRNRRRGCRDPPQDLALPAGRHRARCGHPRLGTRGLLHPYAGAGNAFGVLIAAAIGIPLYSNAADILPLVEALYDKGLPMGTLLAFMMATVALSLPEAILLRRVLKPQLLAVFVTVVGLSIVAVGYLFNALLT